MANTVEDGAKLLKKLENDFLDGRDRKQLSQYFTNLVKTASIPKEGTDRHNDETVSEQDDEADVNEAVVDKRVPLSSEVLTTSDLESDVQWEKADETGSERTDQTDSEQEHEANSKEEGENHVDERKKDEKRSGQKSRQGRQRERNEKENESRGKRRDNSCGRQKNKISGEIKGDTMSIFVARIRIVRNHVEITRGKAKKQGEQSRIPKALGSDGNWMWHGHAVRIRRTYFPSTPKSYSRLLAKGNRDEYRHSEIIMLLRPGMRQRICLDISPNLMSLLTLPINKRAHLQEEDVNRSSPLALSTCPQPFEFCLTLRKFSMASVKIRRL